jgi:hypothetical protein
MATKPITLIVTPKEELGSSKKCFTAYSANLESVWRSVGIALCFVGFFDGAVLFSLPFVPTSFAVIEVTIFLIFVSPEFRYWFCLTTDTARPCISYVTPLPSGCSQQKETLSQGNGSFPFSVIGLG